MSDTIIGQDRYLISSPVNLRRGSDVVLRRQLFTRDYDSGTESKLDISAATAIVWWLATDFKKATTATLSKTLVSGIALYSGGTDGQLEITIAGSDTKDLTLAMYFGEIAVVIRSKRYKFAPYKAYLLAAGALGE